MDNADTQRNNPKRNGQEQHKTNAPKVPKPPNRDTTKATEARRRLKATYDLTLIERYAASGLSDAQLATCLGLEEKTVRKLKQREDVKQALARGIPNSVKNMEQAVYLQGLGYYVIEEDQKIDPNTKKVLYIKRYRRYIQPVPTQAQYFLNNRDPKNWKYSSQTDINSTQSIVFSETDKMPADELRKLLDLKKRQLAGEDVSAQVKAIHDKHRERLATLQPGQNQ